MKCRHCAKELSHTFIDLGTAPPSNSFRTEKTVNEPEKCYPLRVLICDSCPAENSFEIFKFAGPGEKRPGEKRPANDPESGF